MDGNDGWYLLPHSAGNFSDRDQRSPTFWSQVRNYTTGELRTKLRSTLLLWRFAASRHFGARLVRGELSTLRGPQGREPVESVEPVYGTNSSGAPFDAR